MKKSSAQTTKDEYLHFITTTKRKPNRIESDQGRELQNLNFHSFLKLKIIHHYSRYSDTGPSKAERINKSNGNLLKKPVFEKRNASWLSELPLVTKKYNNTVHHSTKMTPIEHSEKINAKNSAFQSPRQKAKT